jgi:NAD(P)H dehydrogenase (quinone)
MNALFVIAHPNPHSFSHAMADAAADVLSKTGYTLKRHDLYAEGFNPVQPTVESANTASSDPLVEVHCADLSAADLVLIFHPNWWSQPPAIMKGWIDRVFRLDTAYGYPPGVGYEGLPVGLLKAKHALIFNTSNTPEARERAVFGDPLETLWRTSVFALCGVHSVQRRVFSPVASSTAAQRAAWLDDVRAPLRQVVRQVA